MSVSQSALANLEHFFLVSGNATSPDLCFQIKQNSTALQWREIKNIHSDTLKQTRLAFSHLRVHPEVWLYRVNVGCAHGPEPTEILNPNQQAAIGSGEVSQSPQILLETEFLRGIAGFLLSTWMTFQPASCYRLVAAGRPAGGLPSPCSPLCGAA